MAKTQHRAAVSLEIPPHRRDPIGLLAGTLAIALVAVTILSPRTPAPTCTPTLEATP